MTDNRILSDEQIQKEWSITPCIDMQSGGVRLGRAIEQAILQSPQVQQWRKNAERYQWLRNDCLDDHFGHAVLAPVVFNADDSFNHSDDALMGDFLDEAIDKAKGDRP